VIPDVNGNDHWAGECGTVGRQGLHVCRLCDSRFVYPRVIEEHGEDAWELELHCPECGWTDTGVFGQPVIEEFMNELDRGSDELESDLANLIQANMTDYLDRFTSALAADAIHPMDF
jgi:hypothetical protein